MSSHWTDLQWNILLSAQWAVRGLSLGYTDLYYRCHCSVLLWWKKEDVCQGAFSKPSLECCQRQQCSLGVSVQPHVSACCMCLYKLHCPTFCLYTSVLKAAPEQLLYYNTTNRKVTTWCSHSHDFRGGKCVHNKRVVSSLALLSFNVLSKMFRCVMLQ